MGYRFSGYRPGEEDKLRFYALTCNREFAMVKKRNEFNRFRGDGPRRFVISNVGRCDLRLYLIHALKHATLRQYRHFAGCYTVFINGEGDMVAGIRHTSGSCADNPDFAFCNSFNQNTSGIAAPACDTAL